MKLSVYIVSHNYKSYIAQCIESVLKSTKNYRNHVELAIIDDCSHDGSRDIILQFKDDFDLIIFNKANLGLIKTCNSIISQLSGEYFVRVDADDYVEENFVSEFFSVIFSKGCDLIYPNYYLVDMSGKKIALYERNSQSNVPSFNRPFHGAFTFIKRDFFNHIGGYNEAYTRQDGYYLWLQGILNKARIYHHALPLFNYRQHRGSLSSDKRNLFETRYDINYHYLKGYYNGKQIPIVIPIEHDSLIEKRIAIIKDIDFSAFRVICLIEESLMSLYKDDLENKGYMLHVRRSGEKLTYIEDITACVKEYQLEDFLIFEPEYPFINHKAIMDTVLTALFHDYDVCNTVLLETATCFVQKDLSFKRFNTSKRTRSERNELFRLAGGIKYFRSIDIYEGYTVHGNDNYFVGHIEIDSLSAVRLFEAERLMDAYYNEEKINS